jgi:TPR repeat protein
VNKPKGRSIALAGRWGNHFHGQQFQERAISDGGAPVADDCLDLGVAFSCGTSGLPIDLVEAHKWFNLAALRGSRQGQSMRAEIAEEMTAREIAEAQRQARALIASTQARAA